MTTATLDVCKNCRGAIELRNYISKNWEPDYDATNDPVIWRHSNGYAACFTTRTTFAEPSTMTVSKSVYVASSWRNTFQPAVVSALLSAGFEVYDFKKPKLHSDGFHWSEVMPSYSGDTVAPEDYLEALEHPRAEEGYELDFSAMQAADTCVLVLPCNRSAHLELGWFVGQGRRTAVLLEDGPVIPELMYKMIDLVTPSLVDLLGWLGVGD